MEEIRKIELEMAQKKNEAMRKQRQYEMQAQLLNLATQVVVDIVIRPSQALLVRSISDIKEK